MTQKPSPLSADQVLVTVGTLNSVSSLGTTETHRAMVEQSPVAIAFAAFDAGLVEIDVAKSTAETPRFLRAGSDTAVAEIESEFGQQLRAAMGIRQLPPGTARASHLLSDVAAPLPHDLENGGLRRLAGLTFKEVRQSELSDMFGLFDDDPRLGPGLQSQLFLYGGLGSLASLPKPLRELVPDPSRFRLISGTAFPGLDSHHSLLLGMQAKRELVEDKKTDKLAFRLASSLTTHGPAMVAAMLAPGISLSRVRRKPEILESLVQEDSPFKRVPQVPMITNAACASALVTLADAAVHMVARYPGHRNPQLLMWTAADAGLLPDYRILEGFGPGGMMNRDKLNDMNEGRTPDQQRQLSDCLAPFDVDAQGTVVGHAGSGILVTTLEFALKNHLDITSILVGWGQSSETGGKGHFAGVGFGGENALIGALQMAEEAHGYGVDHFTHLIAHATGTRTNSRTELANLHAARTATASFQGVSGRLPTMTVGAPKSLGDGHTMGETGLKAVGEGIRYLLGHKTVGVPALRQIDPDLGDPAEFVELSASPIKGRLDGGVLIPTQGFGGYDGAVALCAATEETLSRYEVDERILGEYLERWPELRSERIEREARWRRTLGFGLQLAEMHRWHGAS